MTGLGWIRWATPADDQALRRLCRRTPMVGPISYCLEREPEFFALTRLQGIDGGRVAVVDDGAGGIVAMAMMAVQNVWIAGEKERVAYLGDLKVDPDYRRAGLGSSLRSFVTRELQAAGITRAYFLVLSGNATFRPRSSGSPFFRRQRLIRNFIVPFGSRRSRPSGIAITPASLDAIPDMLELWNRCHAHRAFAPVLDEALLAQWSRGSGSLADFRLARRHGRLVGFCSASDGFAIKQIRLLRLSPVLSVLTGAYNVAAPLLRRPKFPPAGDYLRFMYVSHVCAEGPDVLTSLLDAVHDEQRDTQHLYFDLALDCADPLAPAMKRYRSMKVNFDLWESRADGPPGPIEDCAFFDVSLV